jgi:hypothetical protein
LRPDRTNQAGRKPTDAPRRHARRPPGVRPIRPRISKRRNERPAPPTPGTSVQRALTVRPCDAPPPTTVSGTRDRNITRPGWATSGGRPRTTKSARCCSHGRRRTTSNAASRLSGHTAPRCCSAPGSGSSASGGRECRGRSGAAQIFARSRLLLHTSARLLAIRPAANTAWSPTRAWSPKQAPSWTRKSP